MNLGCGFKQFKKQNVVNLDMYNNCKPDVVHDLAKVPMPFKDGTFDFIMANHILEHVPNWWGCFEDCCRILKYGGTLELWVPGCGSDTVLGFRDHINTINHCSFFGIRQFYRNPGNAWAAEHGGGPANEMALEKTWFNVKNEWWVKKAPEVMQMWMAKHLRNIVVEIGFIFKKVKS